MKKENRDLLKMRARAMALTPEKPGDQAGWIEVVSFSLGTESYCIESTYIREVYQMKDFTPLPGVPPHIFGVINVRGQILPVVNLKKILHFPDQGLGELNKVIILSNDQMEFGILTDVVHGTLMVLPEELQEVPHLLVQESTDYLKGVTRDGLILLNAGKLLSDEKLVVND